MFRRFLHTAVVTRSLEHSEGYSLHVQVFAASNHTDIYVTVPEKRDLNEANMKIEIHYFSFSSQYALQNEL